MIHLDRAFFVQFQSLEQFLRTFITHAVRNDNDHTAVPTVFPHQWRNEILIEVLLPFTRIYLVRLICQNLVPLISIVGQILVRISIFYKVPDFFGLDRKTNCIHIVIELSVMAVDLASSLRIFLYHTVQRRLECKKGNPLQKMPCMIDLAIPFAVLRAEVATGFHAFFAYLRNTQPGNLLIQHIVFDFRDHPAEEIFVEIGKRITFQNTFQRNPTNHSRRIQLRRQTRCESIIKFPAFLVVHQVLYKHDRVILSGGEERFPCAWNITR